MKICSLLILIILLGGCGQNKNVRVDANVLTIAENITEGKLIGHFLGSSSGWLKTDTIKVGVEFTLANKLFLEDLELSHAQLAYYRNEKSLPLSITITDVPYCIKIRLNGYFIKMRDLSAGLVRDLLKEF